MVCEAVFQIFHIWALLLLFITFPTVFNEIHVKSYLPQQFPLKTRQSFEYTYTVENFLTSEEDGICYLSIDPNDYLSSTYIHPFYDVTYENLQAYQIVWVNNDLIWVVESHRMTLFNISTSHSLEKVRTAILPISEDEEHVYYDYIDPSVALILSIPLKYGVFVDLVYIDGNNMYIPTLETASGEVEGSSMLRKYDIMKDGIKFVGLKFLEGGVKGDKIQYMIKHPGFENVVIILSNYVIQMVDMKEREILKFNYVVDLHNLKKFIRFLPGGNFTVSSTLEDGRLVVLNITQPENFGEWSMVFDFNDISIREIDDLFISQESIGFLTTGGKFIISDLSCIPDTCNEKRKLDVMGSLSMDDIYLVDVLLVHNSIAFVSGFNVSKWVGKSGNNNKGELYLFDVQVLSTPKYLSTIDPIFSQVRQVDVRNDDQLFVAACNAGLRIYDISDPKNPKLRYDSRSQYGYSAVDFKMSSTSTGFLGFVADETGGLRIIKVPSKDYRLWSLASIPQDVVGRLEGHDVKCLCVGNSDGNKNNFVYFVERELLPFDAVEWNYMENRIFRVVDVSDLANPRIVGSFFSEPRQYTRQSGFEEYQEGESVFGLAVSGDERYAYLLDKWVTIIDISDKENPKEVSKIEYVVFETPLASKAIYISDNYLYICQGQPGVFSFRFTVYDVSNHSNPEKLGFYEGGELAYGCYDIAVRKNFAFVASGEYGLRVFDVTDKKKLRYLGGVNTRFAEHVGIVEHSDTVYLSGRQENGFVVVDSGISKKGEIDEVHPKLVDASALTGSLFPRAGRFDSKDNFVFLTQGVNGIVSIHLDLKVSGSDSLSSLCGSSMFRVIATDSSNSQVAVESFIEKEGFCNNHGKCKEFFECECDKKYFGMSCESWDCGGILSTEAGKVCSGNGVCVAPDECSCVGSIYFGKYCQTNILIWGLALPVGLILICCCILFVCTSFIILFCCCVVCSLGICLGSAFVILFVCGVCCFSFCSLSGIIGNLGTSVRKYKKLKNFDLHLQEQLLEEDETVAHFKFNKDLFKINFNEIGSVSILGEGGSSSVVYKVKWKGQDCAFKCFKTRHLTSNKDRFDEFEKELALLSSLAHPNIIRFFGACLHPPRVGILMEFCSNGELLQFVKKFRRKQNFGYPFSEKIRLLTGVTSALEFLHSKSIIHRDLKCENVLISSDEVSKLMDFGLSRFVSHMSVQKTKRIGTSHYMAPEVYLTNAKYNEKVDVFSFSIMFFVLLTALLGGMIV